MDQDEVSTSPRSKPGAETIAVGITVFAIFCACGWVFVQSLSYSPATTTRPEPPKEDISNIMT